MKYGLGIRMLIAFIAGGIAVVYKIKLNPRYKQSEINVAIKAPKRFTFDTLTNPSNVPQYFSWVSNLRESEFDRRNISLGKVYYGEVNLPFLGQHEIRYKITELKDFNWLTLRPDLPKLSWFNTEITFTFFSITKEETVLGVKVAYHRTSALFQITMGRYLRYITDQQLTRLGIAAKNLVHKKWEKFRYPHGRDKSKNVPKSAEYVFKMGKKHRQLQNETSSANAGNKVRNQEERGNQDGKYEESNREKSEL